MNKIYLISRSAVDFVRKRAIEENLSDRLRPFCADLTAENCFGIIEDLKECNIATMIFVLSGSLSNIFITGGLVLRFNKCESIRSHFVFRPQK